MLIYPGLFFPSNHQGADSFGNLEVSFFVIENGLNIRLVNSFSFFGLTPYSNNMGGTFLLTSVSILTGLSPVDSILILSYFLAISSFFAMFFLSRNFVDNNFAVISSTVLLSSRLCVEFHRWTFSLRSPYFFLYLIILGIIIKYFLNKTKDINRKHLYLILIFGISSFSLHKLFYFNWLFFVSLPFFAIFRYNKFLFYKYDFVFESKIISLLKVLILLSLTTFSLLGYSIYKGNVTDFQSIFNAFYFIIFEYALGFGFLLCLVPLGFIFSLDSKKESDVLIYLMSLSCSLVWFDYIYSIWIIMPLLAIYAVKGLYNLILFSKKGYGFTLALAFIILLPTQLLPEYITVSPTEYLLYEDDYDKNSEILSGENTGFYMNEHVPYPMLTNTVGPGWIAPFAKVPFQYSEVFSPVYSSDERWVLGNLSKIARGEFDQLFKDTGPEGANIFYKVIHSGKSVDDVSVQLEMRKLSVSSNDDFVLITYSPKPQYSIRDSELDSEISESIFINSVLDSYYKTYSSEYHQINYIKI